MKQSCKFIILATLLFSYSFLASQNQWRYAGGLEGGSVSSITVINEKAFLISDEGLFSSADKGKSWEKVDITTKININDPRKELSLVQAAGQNLFLATRRGLYASTDNGETFTLFNNGLPRGRPVIGLKSDGTKLITYTAKDVYLYNDQEKEWKEINYNLPKFVYIKDAEFVNNKLYVATFGKGVFEYNEPSSLWIEKNDSISTEKIVCLGSVGNTLLAGTNREGLTTLRAGTPHWQTMSDSLPPKISVLSLITAGGRVFAGTANGIWASNDNCNTWYLATPDLPKSLVINTFCGSGSTLYAGTDGGGVLVSTNMGATWNYANVGLSISLPIKSLLYHSGMLFAGTAGGGAYRSDNGGRNWKPINSGLPKSLNVNDLAIQDSLIYLAAPNGIFTSADWGESWRNSGGFFLVGKAFSSVYVLGDIAYIGASDGIYFSHNYGSSWFKLGIEGMTNSYINSIDIAIGKKDTTIYVCTNDGFYFSKSHSGVWTKTGGDRIDKGLMVKVLGKDIYVNTDRFFSVVKSGLAADKWEMLPAGAEKQGIPGRFTTTNIVLEGKKDIYIAGDKGVFFSHNRGKTWNELNFGLFNTNIGSFIVTAGMLYAGDGEGNIYSLSR